MIVAVDFDGTCVFHDYPEVGDDCPKAVDTLKWLVSEGHQLVLYTMRTRKELQDAIDWFGDKGIELAGIQYSPGQTDWTSSNKCYAEVYIDDAALGAPLINDSILHARHFVDWSSVKDWFKENAE